MPAKKKNQAITFKKLAAHFNTTIPALRKQLIEHRVIQKDSSPTTEWEPCGLKIPLAQDRYRNGKTTYWVWNRDLIIPALENIGFKKATPEELR